jgi:hypothetical protein
VFGVSSGGGDACCGLVVEVAGVVLASCRALRRRFRPIGPET